MNQTNRSITFSILLALLSVTLFFQTSFLPFIDEVQSIKDNSINREGNLFASAAAGNRLTYIFLLCNFCSFLLSTLIAFFSNLFSSKKIFTAWYWFSLAGIFLFMIAFYKFYFFDRISFYPGLVFSVSVLAQTIINISCYGVVFFYVYARMKAVYPFLPQSSPEIVK